MAVFMRDTKGEEGPSAALTLMAEGQVLERMSELKRPGREAQHADMGMWAQAGTAPSLQGQRGQEGGPLHL